MDASNMPLGTASDGRYAVTANIDWTPPIGCLAEKFALEGSDMRLMIDTSRVSFTVSREPQAKLEQGTNPAQKRDRNTGFPLWTVQLVAMEADGAEVINVAIAGEQPPKVAAGQLVTPVELQAIPWAQNGKNGVAFRVSDLKVASGSKAASVS